MVGELPTDKANPSDGMPLAEYQGAALPIPGSDTFWSSTPMFELREDQPNHWTIHLPDKLIKVLHEKLKDQKKN